MIRLPSPDNQRKQAQVNSGLQALRARLAAFHPSLQIQLDWKAYFKAFCEVHGDPLHYNGLLLFGDGWRYALGDPSGEEYPPPEDAKELNKLLVLYWKRRLAIVTWEARRANDIIENYEAIGYSRSLPLKQIIRYNSEDPTGNIRTVFEAKDLDLSPARERLKWLEDDRSRCEAKLKEISEHAKTS